MSKKMSMREFQAKLAVWADNAKTVRADGQKLALIALEFACDEANPQLAAINAFVTTAHKASFNSQTIIKWVEMAAYGRTRGTDGKNGEARWEHDHDSALLVWKKDKKCFELVKGWKKRLADLRESTGIAELPLIDVSWASKHPFWNFNPVKPKGFMQFKSIKSTLTRALKESEQAESPLTPAEKKWLKDAVKSLDMLS